MSRVVAVNCGLALGLVAGAWDGIAILVENPRSFDGALGGVAFLGAALALSVAVGGAVGLGVAAGSGRGARDPGRILVPGLALWIFGWAGVRVHVRWFFGEPLLSPGSLLVNVGLAVVSGLAAMVVWRIAGGRVTGVVARGSFTAAAVVVAILGVVATRTWAPPGPAARAGAAAHDARDILLVTLDTTRADHLSCYGYPRGTTPAIDRLARTSCAHARAYAPIPLTNPSHVSMMTGRTPREHGVLNNGTALPEHIPTIVREISEAGWSCAAFVSGIPLKASLSGLAPGFQTYDATFSRLESVHPMMTALATVRVANRILPFDLIERRAEKTCAAAIRWLAESSPPRFLWVHLFDPHTPYDAPEVLERRFARESVGWTAAGGKPVTGWPVSSYDAEIRETDRWLEDLLRAFRNETNGEGLVLLTADHGEGLEQHGELTHGSQLYEEDLRVPYVFVHPQVSLVNWVGTEFDVPVTSVAETLRAFAFGGYRGELDPPVEPIVAETFAPEGKEDQTAIVLTEDGGTGKLFVNRETGSRIGFDLTHDPGERQPVEPTGPEWEGLSAALPRGEPPRHSEPDPEAVRRLRALGYAH